MEPQACEGQPLKISIQGKQGAASYFERHRRNECVCSGKGDAAFSRLTEDRGGCFIRSKPARLYQGPLHQQRGYRRQITLEASQDFGHHRSG